MTQLSDFRFVFLPQHDEEGICRICGRGPDDGGCEVPASCEIRAQRPVMRWPDASEEPTT
jgi:hypothetical protein